MKLLGTILAVLVLIALVAAVSCVPSVPTPAPSPKPTVAPSPTPTSSPAAATPKPVTPGANWPREARFLSASVGSQNYAVQTYWAQVITNDVKVTTGAFPGSMNTNLALVNNGEGEFCYGTPAVIIPAWKGEKPFEKALTNLRFMFTHMPPAPAVCAVRADSKIVNIEDLVGKRVSFEAKGSMSETTALAVMNAAGITPDKIRAAGGVVTNSSYQAMADGLADGTLDAAWFNSPGKSVHSTFLAVNERFGLRLVKVSDAVIDQVIKANPIFGKTTIPAGIYKGNTAPISFVGSATTMYVRGDLPEDFVYAVVSTIYKPDYAKNIAEKFDFCFDFGTVDAGLIGANYIPMHPGSAKYFRDDRKIDLAARGITAK